jgi:hypothetical protein
MTVDVQNANTRPEKRLNLLAIEDALCGDALDPERVAGAASGNISYLRPSDESFALEAGRAESQAHHLKLVLGGLAVAAGAVGIAYSLMSRKKVTR